MEKLCNLQESQVSFKDILLTFIIDIMKSSIISFFFAAFFASTCLAQDQIKQTQPQSPPQGWYQQESEVTKLLNQVDNVFFFSKDSGWAVGYQAGFIPIMIHTEDGGATWINCTTLPKGWTPFRFLDYKTGFAFTGDSIIKTTDAGITWGKPKFGIVNGYIASTSVGRDTIFTLANGIGFSSDRGETWKGLPVNFSNTVFPHAFAFADSKNGWVMGGQQNYPPNQALNGAGLTKTKDGGQTWLPVYSGIHADIYAIFGISNSRVFAGGGGLYLSTDAGHIWQKIPLNTPNIGFEAIDFADSLHGWCVGLMGVSSGGIIGTKDGGLTWNLQLTDTVGLFDISVIDSLTAWAVGDKGKIFHTIDGGKSWVRQYLAFDSIVIQTYPDPIRKLNFSFHFTIPTPQHISLTLFDLTGKPLQTFLKNEFETQGEHTVPVTLIPLANGTYFYLFQTEKYQSTGKITILH